MALKSTIYKADVQIADMDRNHYADYALTLARHPSETDERMMVRLLAFALHADSALGFGRGLSTEDEPDLWQHDLTGAVQLWIEVGLPDEKRLRRACGRAAQVVVVAYGGRPAEVWWEQNRATMARLDNLGVVVLPAGTSAALTRLTGRGMRLQCSIQDGQVWLTDGAETVHLEPVVLKRGAR